MKIQCRSYLGLICHTIIKKSNVKYFIFVDIDTKDKEILRSCMQEVARFGLSFWIIETKKGYHIISPNMLDVIQWHRLKTSINKFLDNYYVYYVIRIKNKSDDKLILYNDEYDSQEFKKSSALIRVMEKRFKKKFDLHPKHLYEESILNFLTYEHHEIDSSK